MWRVVAKVGSRLWVNIWASEFRITCLFGWDSNRFRTLNVHDVHSIKIWSISIIVLEESNYNSLHLKHQALPLLLKNIQWHFLYSNHQTLSLLLKNLIAISCLWIECGKCEVENSNQPQLPSDQCLQYLCTQIFESVLERKTWIQIFFRSKWGSRYFIHSSGFSLKQMRPQVHHRSRFSLKQKIGAAGMPWIWIFFSKQNDAAGTSRIWIFFEANDASWSSEFILLAKFEQK